MKRLLFIFLFPIFGFSQEIPDTCFTEEQIKDISITLDSLYELSDINDKIITEQESMIAKQSKLIKLDSIQIAYQEQQVAMLKRSIDLYVEREKHLKPKWYDNKAIWFSGGILTTILTSKLIIEVVK